MEWFIVILASCCLGMITIGVYLVSKIKFLENLPDKEFNQERIIKIKNTTGWIFLVATIGCLLTGGICILVGFIKMAIMFHAFTIISALTVVLYPPSSRPVWLKLLNLKSKASTLPPNDDEKLLQPQGVPQLAPRPTETDFYTLVEDKFNNSEKNVSESHSDLDDDSILNAEIIDYE